MKKVIYYIDGAQSHTCVRTEQTERERQMRLARERLTEEFVELLSIDPEEGTRWTGPVADLVEVAHIAYVQGTVCGSHGTACTFRELVNRACAVLHVKVPRNPRACVYQAARRKGVRSSPYIERYARRLMMEKEKKCTDVLMENLKDFKVPKNLKDHAPLVPKGSISLQTSPSSFLK